MKRYYSTLRPANFLKDLNPYYHPSGDNHLIIHVYSEKRVSSEKYLCFEICLTASISASNWTS